MAYWETAPLDGSVPVVLRDFTRIWRAAEKVVYSRVLESVSSTKTRIERRFDAHEVRHLKSTSGRSVSVGGAGLAGQAIESGLVDGLHLLVVPVVVGGGKAWLPKRLRLDLELLDTRRLASGAVFLRYRPAP